jgi:predicted N-acetyltransferase YhbS
MQKMVADRTLVMGPCTNLHPGDVAHRIYSGLRSHHLADVVPVYVDERGMAGFGIIWPSDGAFDVVTRVGLDRASVSQIFESVSEVAGGGGSVETDVIGDDTMTASVLTDIGFNPAASDYVFTRAALDGVPSGGPQSFTIRSVAVADAEQLAAVHSGAFGSGWSAANYIERMGKPGYDQCDEIVAVDASGTFMGFAVTWFDSLNAVGYFEPVGVHRNFHRNGVGSALLREGRERMRRAGMTTATVWHAADDERAVRFYRSNGFTVVNPVTRWVRG